MMPPSPVTVSPDLAEAALACTALARARRLAEWVGAGRELTASGVLRPAVAAEACRALGIPLPGARLRSALDVDELMRDWMVAVAAGFVVADGRRVGAAPGLAAPRDPEVVLAAWVTVAAASLGVPHDPCAGCLIVLHELSAATGPVRIGELAREVAAWSAPQAAGLDPGEGERCPECGRVHDLAVLPGLADLFGEEPGADESEAESSEHAAATVAQLAAFGAAADKDGTVRLTELGSMLARAVFEGCAPARDAGAGELMSTIVTVPPPVARTLARPWLDARSPAEAGRELLAFAESAGGGERVAALAFSRELGPEAAGAWREWAGRPGFGAYARRWLADQGEAIAEDPADDAWLAVDGMVTMLDALPDMLPPLLLAALVQDHTGSDVAEALSLMAASGHPAAADVVGRLTGQPVASPRAGRPGRGGTARGGSAARAGRRERRGRDGSVYQLKISLRGVSKPPVWRRVLVPARMTLGELHEVIVAAMGWHGGHLHVFDDGWQEYGTPGTELGHADEAAVRVRDLLGTPGDRLRYTYDFGDDWDHDLLLEGIVSQAAGETYPSCVAGRGACPPEDCGGVWGYAELKEILADPGHERHQEMLDWLCLDSGDGFDPREFSAEAANDRLGRPTVVW